jgi:hypothetical protein
MKTVTIVRCYCKDCGYAMSAMTIGALIDAQREHEAYMQSGRRWMNWEPPIVLLP